MRWVAQSEPFARLTDVIDALLHMALSVEALLLDAGMGRDLFLSICSRIDCTLLVCDLLLFGISLLAATLDYIPDALFVRLVSYPSVASFSLVYFQGHLLMALGNYCWNFSLPAHPDIDSLLLTLIFALLILSLPPSNIPITASRFLVCVPILLLLFRRLLAVLGSLPLF